MKSIDMYRKRNTDTETNTKTNRETISADTETAESDTNHILVSDYSEVIIAGAETDAIDYKLISLCRK